MRWVVALLVGTLGVIGSGVGVSAEPAAVRSNETVAAPSTEPLIDLDKMKAVRTALVASARAGSSKKDRYQQWPPELLAKAEEGQAITRRAWVDCVGRSAFRYARLPESAEAVADAALGECQVWEHEYRNWVAVSLVASGTSLGQDTISNIMETTNASLRRTLSAAVMKKRLAALDAEAKAPKPSQ